MLNRRDFAKKAGLVTAGVAATAAVASATPESLSGTTFHASEVAFHESEKVVSTVPKPKKPLPKRSGKGFLFPHLGGFEPQRAYDFEVSVGGYGWDHEVIEESVRLCVQSVVVSLRTITLQIRVMFDVPGVQDAVTRLLRGDGPTKLTLVAVGPDGEEGRRDTFMVDLEDVEFPYDYAAKEIQIVTARFRRA